MAQENMWNRNRGCGCVLPILVVLFLAAVGSLMPDSPQTGFKSNGEYCTIQSSAGAVLGSINEAIHARVNKLCAAKDYDGLAALAATGVVYVIPSGTQALVIDRGIFSTEVKLISGEYAGRYFIVASHLIE
ncbi:hypothetical protein LCGC14_1785690 [marine sediment metagenome]|uniref:Uncharacterized protein n=2 Tax=marine sediment metagenome TaxID=412755 RepID=A0A0F9J917_9ZZZZ